MRGIKVDIRELITKSSSEQRKALLNKEVSAVELVEAVYNQVDAVEEKIGGEKKYREVIKLGKSMGYQLNCHINQMAMFFISDRWNENDVAKRADGSLFADYYQPSGMAYRPCFQRVHDLWIRDDFPQIKNLGLNGIFHIDVTSYIDPFECCDPRHPLTRKQTAEYQNKITVIGLELNIFY